MKHLPLEDQVRLARRAAEFAEDDVVGEIERQMMVDAEHDLDTCPITDIDALQAAVMQWRMYRAFHVKLGGIAGRLASAVKDLEKQNGN